MKPALDCYTRAARRWLALQMMTLTAAFSWRRQRYGAGWARHQMTQKPKPQPPFVERRSARKG
jgi:hypothetical protein